MQGNSQRAMAAALSFIKFNASKEPLNIPNFSQSDFKRRDAGGFNRADKENFSSNFGDRGARGGRGGFRGGASGRVNSSERPAGGQGRGRGAGLRGAPDLEDNERSFGGRGRGAMREQRPLGGRN